MPFGEDGQGMSDEARKRLRSILGYDAIQHEVDTYNPEMAELAIKNLLSERDMNEYELMIGAVKEVRI